MTGVLYLEHLSDEDLALLVEAAGVGGRCPDRVVELLRDQPDAIEDLLGRPEVFAFFFGQEALAEEPGRGAAAVGAAGLAPGAGGRREPLLSASPLLVFAVLVRRGAEELRGVRFVQEWVGPKQRVPVFDVEGMRSFAADPVHRFYLASLLASYTKVVSGSVWVRTPRGARRRTFSELDPVRLSEVLDLVPEDYRPLVYRRLGDLALFLTGVFPDYAGGRALRPGELQRLLRAAGVTGPQALEFFSGAAGGPGDPFGALAVLEQLGQRWYRLASGPEPTGLQRVLVDVADGFRQARRILNFITDRYVHRFRLRWFPLPGA